MNGQPQKVNDQRTPTPPFRGTMARGRRPGTGWTFDRERRRDVRLHLGEPVILELAIGHRRRVTLESLSLGGLGLTGAPAEWERGWPVAFTLFYRGAALSVVGRVVWRQNQTVGIAFAQRSLDHDLNVQRFLSTFLVGRS